MNPSIIVELSATPTDASNVLVDIKGVELKREDMIKLDLHINNKELAEEKSWTELGLEFPERKIVFELVFGDEWQKVLNRLLK